MAEPVSNARPVETTGLLRSDEAAKLLAISPRTLWTLTVRFPWFASVGRSAATQQTCKSILSDRSTGRPGRYCVERFGYRIEQILLALWTCSG